MASNQATWQQLTAVLTELDRANDAITRALEHGTSPLEFKVLLSVRETVWEAKRGLAPALRAHPYPIRAAKRRARPAPVGPGGGGGREV